MAGRMRQGMGSGDRSGVASGFALILGLGYVAAGVLGFIVTGFEGLTSNDGDKLLSFDVNIFHNIVHLAIGAWLVIASTLRNPPVTQGTLIGVGLFYLVAALLGFTEALGDANGDGGTLSIISIDQALVTDNFLHLFSGAAALIFGLISVQQSDEPSERKDIYGTREGPLPLEERRAMWEG